jgi:hypothetical protein
MPIDRLYRAALRLYPADYRARFGREMRAAFEAAAHDARRRGSREYVAFVVAETMALTGGVCREWMVKLASDPAARARTLPDCRLMRPVGITRSEWIAGLDDGA